MRSRLDAKPSGHPLYEQLNVVRIVVPGHTSGAFRFNGKAIDVFYRKPRKDFGYKARHGPQLKREHVPHFQRPFVRSDDDMEQVISPKHRMEREQKIQYEV